MRISDQVAIVLAGGFGTRLASLVSDRPKPMANIAGRPFLERLLDRLHQQGIRRVVLAVGHKREIIITHFGTSYRGMSIAYSEETEPLGTGGALRRAFEEQQLERAFAVNGDTYCGLEYAELLQTHEAAGSPASLSLLKVADASRYGAVELGEDGRVIAFREKSPEPQAGLINAGVYFLERRVFELGPAQTRFSFEQDLLQAAVPRAGFAAHVFDGLFIDIGVPDDYRRAQTLLRDV